MQKKTFIRGGEGGIKSYSWTDAAQGLGYITYYGVTDGTTNIISTEDLPSLLLMEKVAMSSAWTITDNNNWDLLYNLPQIVSGNLYVSQTVEHQGGNGEERIDANVYKVLSDNSTVLLASASGVAFNFDQNSGSSASTKLLLSVPIPTTAFAIGEKIRVNLINYSHEGNDSETYALIWKDGAGRGNSTYKQKDPARANANLDFYNDTYLKFMVPYKVDL